jgi:hypothetical protein
MRNHVGALVETDDLGDLVLDLLTGSLALITYNNYGTGMRLFTVFCDEKGISPRYMLLRPICRALQHGSPELEPSQPTASNPTSQRSTKSFEITSRSPWHWHHF